MIETPRLLLRPLDPEDVERFVGFYADPVVTRYLTPGGRPQSRAQAIELFERAVEAFDEDGFGQFAVVRRDDGAVMGRCGLTVWEVDPWRPTSRARATRPTEIEIGWKLGSDYWGRGYATEAARAVRDDSVVRLHLRRLISLIHPENRASIRVAEKLGMARERTAKTRLGAVLLYSARLP